MQTGLELACRRREKALALAALDNCNRQQRLQEAKQKQQAADMQKARQNNPVLLALVVAVVERRQLDTDTRKDRS